MKRYTRLNTLRGKGFDFSRSAYYMITLVVHDRKRIFGNVQNGKMNLNPLGKIVHDSWAEIPTHYPSATLFAFQVMPDHFHGIIYLDQNSNRSTSTMMNQYKGIVVKRAKFAGIELPETVWQRSFWCKAFWSLEELGQKESYIRNNPVYYNAA